VACAIFQKLILKNSKHLIDPPFVGQKVGQTIREVLTHRDPAKRAASRSRKATNKTVATVGMKIKDSSRTEEITPALTNVAAVFRRTTLPAQEWTTSNDAVPTPDPYDILCGRGADIYDHPGNHLFRQVINAALPRYIEAETKHAKGEIVGSLVDAIHRASPNGFLKYSHSTMTWMKLDGYSSRKFETKERKPAFLAHSFCELLIRSRSKSWSDNTRRSDSSRS
jgi:hypothetical protein